MASPRLLFFFSNDFGEVVNASLFLAAQPLAVHFALPPRLLAYQDRPDIPTRSYTDVADMRSIVAEVEPDIVMLCSGYLFSVNGLIEPDAVASFVQYLKRAGIPVVTTDPWLKFWKLHPQQTFALDLVTDPAKRASWARRLRALQDYLDNLFANVPHLYAMPFSTPVVTSYAFFNPTAAQEFSGMSGTDAAGVDRWVFVLSEEDLKVQLFEHKQAFVEALKMRFREILSVPENCISLIAPDRLTRELANDFSGEDRITFPPFLGFAAFRALVAGAKIVFYWNILSASLQYCLYYGTSPVFLAFGHQARLNEGLSQHVIEHVYQGANPPSMSLFTPIEPVADRLLEKLDTESVRKFLHARYAENRTPLDIVSDILRSQPGDAA